MSDLEVEEWAGLSNFLASVVPSTLSDRRVWMLESSGIYSVKFLTASLIQQRSMVDWFKGNFIWQLEVPKTSPVMYVVDDA